jgi:hypothetical protein
MSTPARKSSILKIRNAALGLMIALSSAVALTPTTAQAKSSDDETPSTEARLEGYQGGAKLDPSGTALTWLLLVVLGAICIGVMFINPKRSHLD